MFFDLFLCVFRKYENANFNKIVVIRFQNPKNRKCFALRENKRSEMFKIIILFLFGTLSAKFGFMSSKMR